MEIFFKTTTHKKPNGKWTTGYIKHINSSPNLNDQQYDLDKEFNSKEEAEKYTIGYCLKEGWTPANKK